MLLSSIGWLMLKQDILQSTHLVSSAFNDFYIVCLQSLLTMAKEDALVRFSTDWLVCAH